MSRRFAVCFLLLIGLLVGITVEPDSGTPLSLGRPDVTGTTVGANYPKPLPKITTVDEVAKATILTLVVILAMALLVHVISILRTPEDLGPRRSLLWARVPARRGPPALCVG
jgi:hypothetical protein